MSEPGETVAAEAPVIGAFLVPGEQIVPIGRTLDVDFSDTSSEISDTDSTLGTDFSSSSVTDYRVENGRRYHAYHDGGTYYLPNDELEIDRLNLQHHIWGMTLNGAQYISPLPSTVQHVLDIGCGTGKWAIEFASKHPQTQVIGIDLSPIQPPFVPPNCTFMVDNAEQEWVYNHKFDYIHARALVLGIHDWPKLIRQAWDFTNPGGWIELQEGMLPLKCDDGSAAPDSPLLKWSSYMQEATRNVGLDSSGSSKFTEQLKAQGYVNLQHESIKWALGGWPKGKKEKEIGRWTLENLLQGLGGVSMALLTRHLGWSREAVEELVNDARNQMKDPNSHVYIQITIHSAQKPPES